ncbi:OmpA family protein [Nitrosophilus alvini]|uniref:OmpA family protein n=1 Tax=Nitrosophilus alvini TaxID=2714855 RepID=UPI00190B70AD|nr:OmpA family protein [Nitrosophilus alvini]
MGKKIVLCAAVILLSGLAYGGENSYEAAVTGAVEFTDNDSALEDNLKNWGIRGNKRLTDNWLAGISFEQSNNADYSGLLDETDINRFALNAIYEFTPQNSYTAYIIAGLGYQEIDNEKAGLDDGNFAQLGVGWKTNIIENLDFLLEARYLRDFENAYNDFALTAGLSIPFGAKKAAPVPEPKPVPVQKGRYIPLDSDNDGVIDENDKCPATPINVKVDTDGCPLDTDGDGVYDYLDRCPHTPKGVKVDEKGCPLDSDGDGVYDYLDKCPGTPKGFQVDKNGCPIIYNFRINFDFNSAKIKPQYLPKIKTFAEFLKRNKPYKAEIQGHTDSIGSKAYNKKLSERRAKAVYEMLIKLGVEPERLTYIGYGEEMPIADNSTEEGRAKNRRVEAHLFY